MAEANKTIKTGIMYRSLAFERGAIDADKRTVEMSCSSEMAVERWFGFEWQEGLDCGGPYAPYSQSERRQFYIAAFEKLLSTGHVYPCVCSRQDVLRALRSQRPDVDFSHPTYYLANPKIADDPSPHGLPPWQLNLFRWLARNARPLTDSLGLPPNSVIEFGVEVKL